MDLSAMQEAYERILLIRRFEERLAKLKADGEIPGSIHLCNGQEAIPVGACLSLLPGDSVTATYRGHGWALARGTSPIHLFAEIMGRQSDLCGGRGGSPYLSDANTGFLGENSIVGAGVPIAVGAAWVAQPQGGVSVVSIGDGALNQGSVSEGMNIAAAFSLPLVIVVENNVYSEMTPVRDMVAIDPLADRATGFGIPSATIDGNDVRVVAEAVAESVERAREGGGPSFIEAQTERLVGHYSGDAQGYRPRGEVQEAATREPLVRLRSELDDGFIQACEQRVDAHISESVAAARNLPEPSPETVMEHIYA